MQTLLDVRVSRAFRFSDFGRVELCLDVLNILNDTAEESIRSDVYDAPAPEERAALLAYLRKL